MIDRYTKVVLTVIAVALVGIALRGSVPVAQAAEDVRCTVEGPLDVRVRAFDDDIELKWGFSQPGSSSSSPLHVRQAQ